MSYQQDPLLNHPHFKKMKDLNEGTFGFVQLAKDTRKDEPVSLLWSSRLRTISLLSGLIGVCIRAAESDESALM